jgi:hypothetical protein
MAVVVQRMVMQDYASLPTYFTDCEWACVLDTAKLAELRAQVVFKRAALLGLKALSEPTSALLTALYLIASDGLVGARETQAGLKHETLKMVKSQYRKFVADHPEFAFLGPSKLPASPAEFASLFPEVWAVAYGETAPSASPAVSLAAVQQIASTVPMRCTNNNVKQRSSFSGMVPASTNGFANQQQQSQMVMMQYMMQTFFQGLGMGNCVRPAPPVLQRLSSRLALPADEMGITYLPRSQAVPTPLGLASLPAQSLSVAPNVEAGHPVETTEPALPLASEDGKQPVEEKKKKIEHVTDDLLARINKNEAAKKIAKKGNDTPPKQAKGKGKKTKESNKGKKKAAASAKTKVQKQSSKKKWQGSPPSALLEKFAKGCYRCRFVTNCTPSCWRLRGY